MGDVVGEKGDVSGSVAEAVAVAVAERGDWLRQLSEAAVAVERAVVGGGSWQLAGAVILLARRVASQSRSRSRRAVVGSSREQ